MAVEFLWFDGCPSHEPARRLLDAVIASAAPGVQVTSVDASDPVVAAAHRFPGSPTIRVNGIDIDPNFRDPGDYAPRCRLFRTADGLRPIPPREWIEAALARATDGLGRTQR